MIRLISSVILAILAIGILSVAGATAAKVGTDEVMRTPAVQVSEQSRAVVLNEAIVPFAHSNASVTVQSDQEVFIGTGNGVDVADYLKDSSHQEITEVDFNDKFVLRDISGAGDPLADPASLDWWTSSKKAAGSSSASFDLDGEPEWIVVTSADPEQKLDATISMGMQVKGVLGWCVLGAGVAVLLLGLAVFLALGWWMNRLRPPKRSRSSRSGPSASAAVSTAGTSGSGGVETRRPNVPEPADDATDSDDDAPPASGADVPAAGTGDPTTRRGARRAAPSDKPSRPKVTKVLGSATRKKPGQKKSGRRAATFAALSVGTVVLSGCAMPVQPSKVEVTPPSKVAMSKGDGPELIASYTESLNKSYQDNLAGIDDLQGEPLLTRTKADQIIREKTGEKATVFGYSDVTVAAPRLDEYPLWAIARATPNGAEKTSQLLLVVRESSTSDWKVLQSVFGPKNDIPAFIGKQDGSVAVATDADVEAINGAVNVASDFLETGKKPEQGTSVDAAAFADYRDYVSNFKKKDSGFSSVETRCEPFADADLTSHAIEAKDNALALAEVRCTLTVKVDESFSLDLGTAIEALLGDKNEGSTVEVTTSHPLVVWVNDKGEATLGTDDWSLIGASTK
ncbi:hypothetical protein LWF01_04100 [Saxibacter everestensis]|uniref:DUF8094 domain-containing protein n=1 Tax=Saxibacter everestensis TaxID=2909229 RepID=A0ABY8QV98_9MICO|nr:hypothetical protein LWF01_04100 [Brevibacteriaceae bacterium ZFBP1038]